MPKPLARLYVSISVQYVCNIVPVFLYYDRCPPVAVVLARKRLAGEKVEACDSFEFDVVELADTMGWQLPLVKRGLRQLQWSTEPGLSRERIIPNREHFWKQLLVNWQFWNLFRGEFPLRRFTSPKRKPPFHVQSMNRSMWTAMPNLISQPLTLL